MARRERKRWRGERGEREAGGWLRDGGVGGTAAKFGREREAKRESRKQERERERGDDKERGNRREEEMLTSRRPGSGTPRVTDGVDDRLAVHSRLAVRPHAKCSTTVGEGSSLIGAAANSNPLAQPRLGSWPAAAEQAVERLLMRMVEDGNGRARAGRGRMKWRGKVVLSFGGGFIGLAVAA